MGAQQDARQRYDRRHAERSRALSFPNQHNQRGKRQRGAKAEGKARGLVQRHPTLRVARDRCLVRVRHGPPDQQPQNRGCGDPNAKQRPRTDAGQNEQVRTEQSHAERERERSRCRRGRVATEALRREHVGHQEAIVEPVIQRRDRQQCGRDDGQRPGFALDIHPSVPKTPTGSGVRLISTPRNAIFTFGLRSLAQGNRLRSFQTASVSKSRVGPPCTL